MGCGAGTAGYALADYLGLRPPKSRPEISYSGFDHNRHSRAIASAFTGYHPLLRGGQIAASPEDLAPAGDGVASVFADATAATAVVLGSYFFRQRALDAATTAQLGRELGERLAEAGAERAYLVATDITPGPQKDADLPDKMPAFVDGIGAAWRESVEYRHFDSTLVYEPHPNRTSFTKYPKFVRSLGTFIEFSIR